MNIGWNFFSLRLHHKYWTQHQFSLAQAYSILGFLPRIHYQWIMQMLILIPRIMLRFAQVDLTLWVNHYKGLQKMFKIWCHVNAYQNVVDKATWIRNYFKRKIEVGIPNINSFIMGKTFSMHNSRDDIFNISYFGKKSFIDFTLK